MGGAAFPGYTIPRMNHSQYEALRHKCISILESQRFYEHVISPPEAPSKADHGDIDLLVSVPLRQFTADEVSLALGAVQRTKTGLTTSFCVPLSVAHGIPDSEKLFAQVDIHICRDGYLDWELFTKSYGDMLQVLGMLQRPLGLTANDRGLHLRIPEIETRNRKAAMVYLTHEPAKMLRFLGLDVQKYVAGFSTNEEIFEWIVGGRFFGRAVLIREGNENAGDRARFTKRKMFSECMNEWIPAHNHIFTSKRDWTREEVLQDALRWFGDGVRQEYANKMVEHELVDREDGLLARIRDAIPVENEKLGLVMKGLKRWVVLDNGHARLSELEHLDIGDRPRWTSRVQISEQEGVVNFVQAHWETLLNMEKTRASQMRHAKEAKKAALTTVAEGAPAAEGEVDKTD
jgi:hypothetical protein